MRHIVLRFELAIRKIKKCLSETVTRVFLFFLLYGSSFIQRINKQLQTKYTVCIFKLGKYVLLKTYFVKRVPFIVNLIQDKVDSLVF